MSLKLCGHAINWHKPIKFYTLFKQIVALLVFSAMMIAPSYAADVTRTSKQASSESTAPCNIAPSPRCIEMAEKALPTDRTQRSAGPPTPSASAMALVLALGLRNVNGPLERSDYKTMEE